MQRPPMGNMGAAMGQQTRMPMGQQPPMWDAAAQQPRGFAHQQMQQQPNAVQQPQMRMPMGQRMPGEGAMPPPSGPTRTLTPQQQQKVSFMVQRMRSARSNEERNEIMREMQQDPLMLQTILRACERSGQQIPIQNPQQQQQQGSWNGGMQQPRPQMQQYYGANSGGVRMMQQQQQQFQPMQNEMNGPRHMAYGGGSTYGGQQTANNLLNQVRSPQTGSMASPASMHSSLHIQQQLPANIMADSGNDVLDQDKFM
jgi:hypothetical protein